jgi:hypothetical protein
MGPSYTLDLAQCFAVLSRFDEVRRLDAYELNDFMDGNVVALSEWLECIKDYDQSLNVLVRPSPIRCATVKTKMT